MFVEVRVPRVRDPSPSVVQVIDALRRAVSRQHPKDQLFTVQVIELVEQPMFATEDASCTGHSQMMTVVCWQQWAFFSDDPDDNAQACELVAKEVAEAFTDFQVAIWFAQMTHFHIAQPRPRPQL